MYVVKTNDEGASKLSPQEAIKPMFSTEQALKTPPVSPSAVSKPGLQPHILRALAHLQNFARQQREARSDNRAVPRHPQARALSVPVTPPSLVASEPVRDVARAASAGAMRPDSEHALGRKLSFEQATLLLGGFA